MRFGATLSQARFGGLSLERVSASAGYAERRLDAQLALHHAGTPALRATASLPVDLSLLPVPRRLSSDTLRANVRADSVSLALLEAFAPQFQRAVGTFSANVDIGGTWRRPLARGPVTVSGGAVGLSNLGVRLRDIFVNVQFEGDSIRIARLSARSGEQRGDTISLTGVVTARDLENPRFDLTLAARDFHAISRPRVADLWISTSEPLHLYGDVRRSTLEGGITVTRGEIRIPELAQKRVQSLEDAELSQIVDTSVFANRQLVPEAPPRLLQGLLLRQVQIGMGEDVWLRSEEANIKLGGAVNVTTNRPQTGDTTRTQLALEGTLRADRGTYRLILGPLVQRTFTIEEPGTLRFFGDVDLNPTLDIRAVHTVRQTGQQVARQDVRIQVRIGGTLARPTLQLTSADQRLSQSDLISYLVTGQPSFEVVGTTQTLGLAGSALLPTIGSYLGQLGNELGGGAVDVVELQAAGNASGLFNRQGASRRDAVGSLFSGTRLGVGKQIGDRWYVSANTGLCQFGELAGGGNFDARLLGESLGLKVETRLPNDFSLAFGSEPSTSALFCTSQNAAFRGFVATPRQYGFDLFKSWQF
jgi:translocation and assembly module TamB